MSEETTDITTNPFYGNYRGLVVDNLDPAGLGRIKVKVYPMFKGIEDPFLLPWAVPAMSLFAGAGVGYGSFAVPAVDSFVFVFFEAGNIHQPVYFAEAQTAGAGIPLAAQVDYPNSKAWVTPNGCALWINDKDGSEQMVAYHPSGSYIEITPAGTILIYGKEAVTAQAETKDASVIAAATNVNLTAAKDINGIAAEDISLKATKDIRVESVLETSLKSGLGVSVEAIKSVSMSAGWDATIEAIKNATLQAQLVATISGRTVVINGTAGVRISSTVSTLKNGLDALCNAVMQLRVANVQGGLSQANISPDTAAMVAAARQVIDSVLI